MPTRSGAGEVFLQAEAPAHDLLRRSGGNAKRPGGRGAWFAGGQF